MTDIVERLRSKHRDKSIDDYWKAIYDSRRLAADEIERLRSQLASHERVILELQTALERAAAERDHAWRIIHAVDDVIREVKVAEIRND